MRPASHVGGIGLLIAIAAQSFHDAVVSLVGAIFPVPNAGTQAVAPADEVAAFPIQCFPRGAEPNVERPEWVAHPPNLHHPLPLVGLRSTAVGLMSQRVECVAQRSG